MNLRSTGNDCESGFSSGWVSGTEFATTDHARVNAATRLAVAMDKPNILTAKELRAIVKLATKISEEEGDQ